MPSYEFDPFKLTGLTIENTNARDGALSAIAEYVKEQALSHIGDGVSPIQGGRWKRTLSPSYKAQKKEISSADFANLELSGDMLDALAVKREGEKLSYGVEGAEADKADGNNRGTYGASNRTNRSKAREFIPKGNQTFKKSIIQGIAEIIEGYGGRRD